jgi:hypothetical protein
MGLNYNELRLALTDGQYPRATVRWHHIDSSCGSDISTETAGGILAEHGDDCAWKLFEDRNPHC